VDVTYYREREYNVVQPYESHQQPEFENTRDKTHEERNPHHKIDGPLHFLYAQFPPSSVIKQFQQLLAAMNVS
jgi:hypothetical protein